MSSQGPSIRLERNIGPFVLYDVPQSSAPDLAGVLLLLGQREIASAAPGGRLGASICPPRPKESLCPSAEKSEGAHRSRTVGSSPGFEMTPQTPQHANYQNGLVKDWPISQIWSALASSTVKPISPSAHAWKKIEPIWSTRYGFAESFPGTLE
ncbi:unnamed protein product [Cyprideis torosa]|uniref:Uncharacterized protein n=1 Tax=Cyprideis torosa TaxID=163714 RepID=A0A7R8ZIP6_9CRUS|nr:unnamed protein product [Cyprideis torosa]CAG0880428.1 unnamed protein product [Cyprideis torosa]